MDNPDENELTFSRVGSGGVVRLGRPATPGDHTFLIHHTLVTGEEGVIEIADVPAGWTVTPLSIMPRLTGEWLEYRVRFTPPNTEVSHDQNGGPR